MSIPKWVLVEAVCCVCQEDLLECLKDDVRGRDPLEVLPSSAMSFILSRTRRTMLPIRRTRIGSTPQQLFAPLI